jgi:poly(3-hydroxybutyrate) depolymerase
LIAVALTCAVLAALSGHRIVRAFAYNDHDGTIEIDGRTRNYFVHTPPACTGETPLPLVLVLHGATESAENVERLSGMSAKADQENFLVVYPTGTGRMKNVPTSNSGACCDYAMGKKLTTSRSCARCWKKWKKIIPWIPNASTPPEFPTAA